MGLPTVSMVWLDKIHLKSGQGAKSKEELVKTLRRELRAGLKSQGVEPTYLERCVYVIRMHGDFIIGYPNGSSPVLYIGRGDAFGRLSTHLKRWLHQVERFGNDVGIEIRVCRPRRRNVTDMFKHVEADLIARFAQRFGSIPFFNSRPETGYEGCVDYTESDEQALRAAIGTGSGNRPKWVISPAPSNPNYDVYYKGHQ